MWRTRYEAYGNTAAGTVPNGIGFTGHVNDADTGLVYMQQRYYDPIAARFMSLDPVSTDANTGASFGRYHYANNNPYRVIDPDGRSGVYTEGACAGEIWGTCQSLSGTQSAVREYDANSTRRIATVTAFAITGGTVATFAAAGCTAGTGGLCVLGFPTIVMGGIAGGAWVGGTFADIMDWVSGISSTYAGASDANYYAKPPAEAYDAAGPKAPGKPPPEVGFKDPKGGENWVPNPNPGRGGASYGWQDAKGDVWVPSGLRPGRAHSGPHWDVQTPGGGYRNERPPKP